MQHGRLSAFERAILQRLSSIDRSMAVIARSTHTIATVYGRLNPPPTLPSIPASAEFFVGAQEPETRKGN